VPKPGKGKVTGIAKLCDEVSDRLISRAFAFIAGHEIVGWVATIAIAPFAPCLLVIHSIYVINVNLGA